MSTYDMALQRAQFSAKQHGESHFVYHQPEAWETRDTGRHIINESKYYNDIGDSDKQALHCSVTRMMGWRSAP